VTTLGAWVPGTISLDYAFCEDLAAEGADDRAQSWLSAREQQRHDAFVFAHSKREFLATRTLCRGVLAEICSLPPSELQFTESAYGRPALVPNAPFDFNLTNTESLVACVIGAGTVGADAEPLQRLESIHEVAHMVFTDAERERLKRAPELGLDLWVLKESYMKAVGYGMSLPPSTFEMRQGDDGHWSVAHVAVPAGLALPPDGQLQFHLLTLAAHRVAICALDLTQLQIRKRDLFALLSS